MAYTLVEKAELARDYFQHFYFPECSKQLLKDLFYHLEFKFDEYGDDLSFSFSAKNPMFLDEFCRYAASAYLEFEEHSLDYLLSVVEFTPEEISRFSLELVFAKELFDALKNTLERNNSSSEFTVSIGSSSEGGSYHLSLYAWNQECIELTFIYDEKGVLTWQ